MLASHVHQRPGSIKYRMNLMSALHHLLSQSCCDGVLCYHARSHIALCTAVHSIVRAASSPAPIVFSCGSPFRTPTAVSRTFSLLVTCPSACHGMFPWVLKETVCVCVFFPFLTDRQHVGPSKLKYGCCVTLGIKIIIIKTTKKERKAKHCE